MSEEYREIIKRELLTVAQHDAPVHKDILIVVKDQLPFVKTCLESIRKHTKDYTIYLWDNGSSQETVDYLKSVENDDLIVYFNSDNDGFIIPNNRLIERTTSDYIILLNSDTKVYPGWDTAMIAFLRSDPNLAQVGYMGGLLNEMAEGSQTAWGAEIDFIPAWCTCIARSTYRKFGLFDEEHLTFAYCEDADFSLRLKSCGERIYALHLSYVEHFGSQTIKAVHAEGKVDVESSFAKNHAYMRERWKNYLSPEFN